MSLTKIGSIGINTGIQLAGVTTIATLNASDNVLSVGGTVNFVDNVSFGGTVSIAGTLTYEDVTNVDSVGLITARNGIVVGSGITLSKDGDIFATGITTVSGNVKVGSGVTLSPDGDVSITGVTTFTGHIDASSDVFISDKIIHAGDTNTTIRFPSADTVTVETAGSERLRIASTGKLTISNHGTNDLRSLSVLAPATQIQFGTANDVGGFLMSSNNGQFGLSGGGYFNGSSWVATHTGSTQIRTDGDGDISFCSNTSLTSGNTFTPSEKVTIKSTGNVGVNNASPSAILDVVSADASGYIAEFRQSNTSNSGQIIIDSPTDGDSRPVLIDMARAGTVKWSIGQGYNSSGGAFHIATSTLQSGASNAKVTINTDGDMGVGTGGNDPTQRLDVRESNSSTFNATSNLPTQIRAYNTSSTNGACAGIQIRTDNNAGAAGIQYIHAVNTSTNYDSDLVFSRRIASSGTYAESCRITNAGNLKFPNAKGIDFSATSDASGMASELLDDYEEGTWTPFVGTQSGNDYTLGTTYNYYTKIGNIVHAHFKYQFTGEGNGSITLFNIPFAADANVDLVGQGYVTSGSTRLSIQYVKYTQTILLPRVDDGVNYQNYWTSRGSWAPTNTFVMHITYKVA